MEDILNKLERKFGRYAIKDLIKYVIVLYCAGAVIGLLDVNIYYNFLSLDFSAIFKGQVYRLLTYLIEPYGFLSTSGGGLIISIIFLIFQVNIFFLFGRSLESAWGAFRFNLYFFSGWFLNIIAALILYLSPLHSTRYESGFQYIYWAMFFAFALLYPDVQLALFAVIPIKVKWLAILDAVYLLYMAFSDFFKGISFAVSGSMYAAGAYISMGVAVIVSMLNFLIFFFASKNYKRISPGNVRRRKKFIKSQKAAGNGPRHRCAICGRTELDAPDLDFRFCSKCDGNYEYCSDHLFTHQHIKK